MTPFFLKFTDEDAAFVAMQMLTATDDDGATIGAQPAHTAVAPFPDLALPTGEVVADEVGGEYAVTAPSPDYHLNVLTDDPAVIAAIAELPAWSNPKPETPVVVWAGFQVVELGQGV